jgi:hypothetical protein
MRTNLRRKRYPDFGGLFGGSCYVGLMCLNFLGYRASEILSEHVQWLF